MQKLLNSSSRMHVPPQPPYTPGARLIPDPFFLLRRSGNPPGYTAGVGRGAVGFVTRPDLEGESIASASVTGSGSGAVPIKGIDIVGTRFLLKSAPEKSQNDKDQQQWMERHRLLNERISLNDKDDDDSGEFVRDEGLLAAGPMAEDDREADRIYAQVEDRLKRRRLSNNSKSNSSGATKAINNSLLEAHERTALQSLSLQDWQAMPEAVATAARSSELVSRERFTPLPDSLLLASSPASVLEAASSSTNVDFGALANARERMLSSRLDSISVKTSSSNPDPKAATNPKETAGVEETRRVLGRRIQQLMGQQRQQNSTDELPALLVLLGRAELDAGAGARRAAFLAREALGKDPHFAQAHLLLLDTLNSGQHLESAIRDACTKCPSDPAIWHAAMSKQSSSDRGRRVVLAKRAVEACPADPRLWLLLCDELRQQQEDDLEELERVLRMALEECPQSPEVLSRALQTEALHPILSAHISRYFSGKERAFWMLALNHQPQQDAGTGEGLLLGVEEVKRASALGLAHLASSIVRALPPESEAQVLELLSSDDTLRSAALEWLLANLPADRIHALRFDLFRDDPHRFPPSLPPSLEAYAMQVQTFTHGSEVSVVVDADLEHAAKDPILCESLARNTSSPLFLPAIALLLWHTQRQGSAEGRMRALRERLRQSAAAKGGEFAVIDAIRGASEKFLPMPLRPRQSALTHLLQQQQGKKLVSVRKALEAMTLHTLATITLYEQTGGAHASAFAFLFHPKSDNVFFSSFDDDNVMRVARWSLLALYLYCTDKSSDGDLVDAYFDALRARKVSPAEDAFQLLFFHGNKSNHLLQLSWLHAISVLTRNDGKSAILNTREACREWLRGAVCGENAFCALLLMQLSTK